MTEKKRILMYPLLSSGHMNVCISLAKAILDQHSDKVDVYFTCENEWEKKLQKIDQRFKLLNINYSQEATDRIVDEIEKMKATLKLSKLEKVNTMWESVMNDKEIMKIDKLSEVQIKKLDPHFLVCDQIFSLPAMQGYPFAFVSSAGPSIFGFEDYPILGTDVGLDDKERIRELREMFKDIEERLAKRLEDYYRERGLEPPKQPKNIPLHRPLSEHFTVYAYPSEVDYFDDEMRTKHRLWQIDGPLIPSRIPKPYDLPKEFKKLPGKIIYISLGSVFSTIVEETQRLVDILNRLEHKFIVAKGPLGDKLTFPSNKFIGENYIDQLSVLQVCDLMITHGGNNSFCENFYFGVPQIITSFFGDQVNNEKRITEKELGFSLDLTSYTDDELISTVEKALNDHELRIKLDKISKRIQKENKIDQVASKIVDYVDKLYQKKL